MNEKKDFFIDYDTAQVELEKIAEMLWYVNEDYYGFTNQDIYTKANYYDRIETFLYNIQNSLQDLSNRMAEKVKQAHKNDDKIISPGVEIKNGLLVENGIKQIRMGWDKGFVYKVILSDGSILQNMQYDLNAKIPTDEELKAINDKNNKSKEGIKNG